ncbi:MAG: hypothetical protein JO149_01665, partial [Gammaproteobacteria bacterium]|nr:hypothetical protein [Gammaproteobacteria bacterium]
TVVVVTTELKEIITNYKDKDFKDAHSVDQPQVLSLAPSYPAQPIPVASPDKVQNKEKTHLVPNYPKAAHQLSLLSFEDALNQVEPGIINKLQNCKNFIHLSKLLDSLFENDKFFTFLERFNCEFYNVDNKQSFSLWAPLINFLFTYLKASPLGVSILFENSTPDHDQHIAQRLGDFLWYKLNRTIKNQLIKNVGNQRNSSKQKVLNNFKQTFFNFNQLQDTHTFNLKVEAVEQIRYFLQLYTATNKSLHLTKVLHYFSLYSVINYPEVFTNPAVLPQREMIEAQLIKNFYALSTGDMITRQTVLDNICLELIDNCQQNSFDSQKVNQAPSPDAEKKIAALKNKKNDLENKLNKTNAENQKLTHKINELKTINQHNQTELQEAKVQHVKDVKVLEQRSLEAEKKHYELTRQFTDLTEQHDNTVRELKNNTTEFTRELKQLEKSRDQLVKECETKKHELNQAREKIKNQEIKHREDFKQQASVYANDKITNTLKRVAVENTCEQLLKEMEEEQAEFTEILNDSEKRQEELEKTVADLVEQNEQQRNIITHLQLNNNELQNEKQPPLLANVENPAADNCENEARSNDELAKIKKFAIDTLKTYYAYNGPALFGWIHNHVIKGRSFSKETVQYMEEAINNADNLFLILHHLDTFIRRVEKDKCSYEDSTDNKPTPRYSALRKRLLAIKESITSDERLQPINHAYNKITHIAYFNMRIQKGKPEQIKDQANRDEALMNLAAYYFDRTSLKQNNVEDLEKLVTAKNVTDIKNALANKSGQQPNGAYQRKK